ncbi:uncharacterized protein LOC8073321 isoform X1 [Sorghum bicolor]|uniref:Uncharacterized protein n=1 Tax=Sorghum bicolor TaxID=4558 RepID=A0A1B6Q1X6_SORBI|nr:uncharacterized protein LOC8073321 isoform X1 [Sorghum bicolor]KXG31910.1 hypothetical protein SORBI_3003G075800 [Sorghum bicolor]|eukprot:XP_021313072.1 uncharacterized protein LOC8073321 isoform X1 [Sorghum bicolor]
MTIDAALLAIVVAFLLPLRLVSLGLRLACGRHSTSARHLRRSCAALAVAAALLAVIFALPRDQARECAAPVASVSSGGDDFGGFREELRSEVEQLKLQLARLESLWDSKSKVVDEKLDPLEEENDRVVRAMELDIQSLINEQENIKIQESLCSSYFGDSIKAIENEVPPTLRKMLDVFAHVPTKIGLLVQILKDGSRKMNSDIWTVSKDTTEKVEGLHSAIKKVQVIADEWVKMNSTINRIWSFTKETEKRVEGLYSDLKKGFKQTKRKVPFWRD